MVQQRQLIWRRVRGSIKSAIAMIAPCMVRTDKSAGIAAAAGHYHVSMPTDIRKNTNVIIIAAMRPTRSEVLEVLARHRRWASRYSVRKAIACNPHTPPPIARRLIPTLLQQDLLTLVGAGIPEAVREQARRLIKRR